MVGPGPAPAGSPRALPPPRRARDRVLRRAWGAYFAIWSGAVLLLLVVGAAELALPPGPRSLGVALGVDLGVVAIGGVLTLRYFRHVWQQTHFPLWKVGRAFILAFLLLVAGLTVSALDPTVVGRGLFAVMLVLVGVLLAYQIRWSVGYVPWEGSVAVGALLVSALGSVAALTLTGEVLVYGAFWLIFVVAWGGCGVSAFIRGEPSAGTGSQPRTL